MQGAEPTTIPERDPAQEPLGAALEYSPDAVVIVNEAGVIVLVNAQTETLFGYERAELLGQPVEVLVPDRLVPDHLQHRDGFMQTPRVRLMGVGLELAGRRKDGSEFPAHRVQPGDLVRSAAATAEPEHP